MRWIRRWFKSGCVELPALPDWPDWQAPVVHGRHCRCATCGWTELLPTYSLARPWTPGENGKPAVAVSEWR